MDLAGDERGVIGDEERDELCDVIGVSDGLEWVSFFGGFDFGVVAK